MTDLESGGIGNPGEKTTRRRFLEWSIGLLGTVGALAWLAAVWAYLRPVVEGSWGVVDVGNAKDIPIGKGVVIPYRDTTLLVIHLASEFVAYSAICTHAGCLVKWDADRGQIICPCHDGVFDTEGNVVSGLPNRSLKRYRVNLVGDRVMIAGS